MSRYIYIYDQHTYRMQADRQARKADTHTDTGKQAGKHRRAGKHAQRDWLDDWLTYIHIYIQTNKRTDRRTGGRTDGRTDEHTHTHTHRNTLLSPPQGYCFHGNQKLIDPVTFTLVMWRSRCAMAVLSRTSPKYLWRLFGSVQLTLCTKIGQKPLKITTGIRFTLKPCLRQTNWYLYRILSRCDSKTDYSAPESRSVLDSGSRWIIEGGWSEAGLLLISENHFELSRLLRVESEIDSSYLAMVVRAPTANS